MPFLLEINHVASELRDFNSVLIVPCRFCPAASAAVKSSEPYIEFARRLLKTAAHERQLTEMKRSLNEQGIETGVFESHLLHQFVLCMWTARRRKALLERAREFDAAVVMGCEPAVATVRNTLESTDCHVIAGLKSEGIMSIQPRFSLLGSVRLDLESVTPYVHPERSDEAAKHLS